MKLAAIYNVWDGVELLRGSMESVMSGVDLFIIVYQNVSNTGEEFHPLDHVDLSGFPCTMVEYLPHGVTNAQNNPGADERKKRNIGLDVAKDQGCTHFLHMDCDEYYLDFDQMKSNFMEYYGGDLRGSVAKIYTYFKDPTLRLMKEDNYYVPFIHRLYPHTKAGINTQYPFYVDPTRTITTAGGQVIIIGFMQHYSWIRKDIERKIRNSTAVNNINKSDLLKDYLDPDTGPGTFLKDYSQNLMKVPDYFGIKEMLK